MQRGGVGVVLGWAGWNDQGAWAEMRDVDDVFLTADEPPDIDRPTLPVEIVHDCGGNVGLPHGPFAYRPHVEPAALVA